MSIKSGSFDVSALKAGSFDVSAVYSGATKVWPKVVEGVTTNGLIHWINMSNPNSWDGSSTTVNNLVSASYPATLGGGVPPIYVDGTMGQKALDYDNLVGFWLDLNNGAYASPVATFFSCEIVHRIATGLVWRMDNRSGFGTQLFSNNQWTMYSVADYNLSYQAPRNVVYVETFVRSQGNLKRYINGVLRDNITISTANGTNLNTSILYGRSRNSSGAPTGAYYNGKLFDFKWYNRVLGPAEVTTNYEAYKPFFSDMT